MKSDFQRKLPTRAAHCLFLSGIVSIIAGSALIYRPAGFIVGGVFCGWLAFLISAEMPK